MAYKNIDELPANFKDKLQDGSAQIFMTAFNSAQENGMSEEGATELAWNTVKNDYRQDESGNWRRKADDVNYSRKSVQLVG